LICRALVSAPGHVRAGKSMMMQSQIQGLAFVFSGLVVFQDRKNSPW
jgi:hypothetical protein